MYIEPLVIHKIIDKFQYILIDHEGKVLIGIFHYNRLKKAFLRSTKGPANTVDPDGY